MEGASLTFPLAFFNFQNCTGWSSSDFGGTGFSRSIHQSNACFCAKISMARLLVVGLDSYLMLQQVDSEVSGIDTRRVGVFREHKDVIGG